jgi:multiple sugar transport system ATP-binding protein
MPIWANRWADAVQVTFDHIRKVFGAFVAVVDLNLTIKSGEFVSLLGPSGCGKTTTLRMLAGLEQPTSGRILIGDQVVTEMAPNKRDIAMVFQSYALYPHMSVEQNIEYPLRKRKIAKSERIEKVREVANTLQLAALLKRKPRELSGGQQQRVALGRALVRNPSVFLLDEPLSNLDAKLRAHMRGELIEMHRQIQKTMVYVTHDQLEAMTMSDRIAVMSQGRLQQFGAPDEVYHRPRNLFVAGFIGTPSMNFVAGTLAMRDAQAFFRAGELELPVTKPSIRADALAAAPMPVTLGIRPEDVLLGGEGEPASIRIVEPTGHESIVLVDLKGHRLVSRVGNEVKLLAGEPVSVQLRPSKLHLFLSADGERINADLDFPNAVVHS